MWKHDYYSVNKFNQIPSLLQIFGEDDDVISFNRFEGIIMISLESETYCMPHDMLGLVHKIWLASI